MDRHLPLPFRTPTHASTASDSASALAEPWTNRFLITLRTFRTHIAGAETSVAAPVIVEAVLVAMVLEKSVTALSKRRVCSRSIVQANISLEYEDD